MFHVCMFLLALVSYQAIKVPSLPNLAPFDVINYKRPYGPRMCEDLTRRSLQCALYMASHLTCVSPLDSDDGRIDNDTSYDSFICYRGGNGTVVVEAPNRGYNVVRRDGVELIHGMKNINIHQASRNGDLCLVKYILFRGLQDINARDRNNRTAVMRAAGKGRSTVFDFLVSKRCALDVVDKNKTDIVTCACAGGSMHILKRLIVDLKMPFDRSNHDGMTPIKCTIMFQRKQLLDYLITIQPSLTEIQDSCNILHFACITGKVEMVEHILNHKFVDINSRGKRRRTPLMFAIIAQKLQVVDFLFNISSCDRFASDGHGNNVLHCACAKGKLGSVQYLVKKGIYDLDLRGSHDTTPLLYAAGSCHLAVVKYLRMSGCNMTVINVDRYNILHFAARHGCVHVLKYVLEERIVNIEEKGQDNFTALLMAIYAKKWKVFITLISKGANVSVVSDKGNNILHAACHCGNIKVVKYILQNLNISIDSRNMDRETPVILAHSYLEIVKLLVQKRCNIDLKNNQGYTVFYLACYYGNVPIIKYLLSVKPSLAYKQKTRTLAPMIIATIKGHKDVFDILHASGCRVDILDKNGRNLLHLAAISGNYEIGNSLLRSKPSLMNSKNKYGVTPIGTAAFYGNVDFMKLLMVRGCDIHEQNILYYACKGNRVTAVKYILSITDIEIESRGRNDRTPVMTAAKYGSLDVVKFLVGKGCDLAATDKRGDNVLHLAVSENHPETIKYLVSLRPELKSGKNTRGETPKQKALSLVSNELLNLLT